MIGNSDKKNFVFARTKKRHCLKASKTHTMCFFSHKTNTLMCCTHTTKQQIKVKFAVFLNKKNKKKKKQTKNQKRKKKKNKNEKHKMENSFFQPAKMWASLACVSYVLIWGWNKKKTHKKINCALVAQPKHTKHNNSKT